MKLRSLHDIINEIDSFYYLKKFSRNNKKLAVVKARSQKQIFVVWLGIPV